jgi:hypothetical protein
MSYNVLATSFFERELKALAKKHSSLKKDLEALITVTRSAWLSAPKEKENPAAHASTLTSTSPHKTSTY